VNNRGSESRTLFFKKFPYATKKQYTSRIIKIVLFKNSKSSAKTGSSLVRFGLISSPAVLKTHSEGTEDAVVQNTKLSILDKLGIKISLLL